MDRQILQLKKLPKNVQAFWEEKQRTLDDTLLRFSYAVLITPSGMLLREKGGLLYLMRRALWFEDFPNSSTFSFLLQQSAAQYKKLILHMPLARLEHIQFVSSSQLNALFFDKPSQPGLLQQISLLFGAGPNCVFLRGTDSNGRPFRYAFRDVEDPEAWIRSISEAGSKDGTSPSTDHA